jgi:hypothetical protein
LNRSAQKARSAARVAVAVLCFALLMLLSMAAVEMMGPSRKHHDRTGGWAYAHYPWIWAVGVLSALVTGALVVRAYVVRARRRAGDGPTADGGYPARSPAPPSTDRARGAPELRRPEVETEDRACPLIRRPGPGAYGPGPARELRTAQPDEGQTGRPCRAHRGAGDGSRGAQEGGPPRADRPPAS